MRRILDDGELEEFTPHHPAMSKVGVLISVWGMN